MKWLGLTLEVTRSASLQATGHVAMFLKHHLLGSSLPVGETSSQTIGAFRISLVRPIRTLDDLKRHRHALYATPWTILADHVALIRRNVHAAELNCKIGCPTQSLDLYHGIVFGRSKQTPGNVSFHIDVPTQCTGTPTVPSSCLLHELLVCTTPVSIHVSSKHHHIIMISSWSSTKLEVAIPVLCKGAHIRPLRLATTRFP